MQNGLRDAALLEPLEADATYADVRVGVLGDWDGIEAVVAARHVVAGEQVAGGELLGAPGVRAVFDVGVPREDAAECGDVDGLASRLPGGRRSLGRHQAQVDPVRAIARQAVAAVGVLELQEAHTVQGDADGPGRVRLAHHAAFEHEGAVGIDAELDRPLIRRLFLNAHLGLEEAEPLLERQPRLAGRVKAEAPGVFLFADAQGQGLRAGRVGAGVQTHAPPALRVVDDVRKHVVGGKGRGIVHGKSLIPETKAGRDQHQRERGQPPAVSLCHPQTRLGMPGAGTKDLGVVGMGAERNDAHGRLPPTGRPSLPADYSVTSVTCTRRAGFARGQPGAHRVQSGSVAR